MGDLVFMAVMVAFFAVVVTYVNGCERIVGPDTAVGTDAEAASSPTTAAGGLEVRS